MNFSDAVPTLIIVERLVHTPERLLGETHQTTDETYVTAEMVTDAMLLGHNG